MALVPVTCMVCLAEKREVDDTTSYREQQAALEGWTWTGMGWVGPNCQPQEVKA